MRPLLIVGATGFIGRHVVARAAARRPVVTASRRPGAADLCLDPLDAEALRAALRAVGPHAVVNCAGAVAGSVAALVEGNVTAVAALAEAVGDVRLVHLGSAAEYGAVPEGVAITERDEPRPIGPYGITKLAGTALAGRPQNAVVLRVFNPIGPGAKRASLLGAVAAQLAAGTAEIHTGGLGAVRDYVDVRDVADAVLAAADGTATGVFNVGSGLATVSRTLVAELVSLVPYRVLVEAPGGGSERSAAVPWHQADVSAIAAAFGWKPGFALSDSVRDLWGEWC